MRIVYVGAFRFPVFDAAAARVVNNAKILKAIGHDVTIISWGGKYRDEDLCTDGMYRYEDIVYIITNEIDTQGGLVSKIRNCLTRGKKSLDIINSFTYSLDIIFMYNASYGWSRKLRKYCNRNHIYLINDITEWYANNELYFFQWIPNHINMTIAQHRIHNKILISSYLNDKYPESNNIIVPPLCDRSEEKWSRYLVDERIKMFDGITLIYAGTPAKKDCVHTVINVVNTLANEGKRIRFIIIGITKEDYIEQYQRELMTSDINDSIVFLGRIPQDLVPAYYKMADFMILLREPTRKNMAGFPTKIAESITAGIPVISNPTSDIAQFIKSGKNGFLVQGNDYDSLLNLLRNCVLNMDKNAISNMKQETCEMRHVFDYKYYIKDFRLFIEKLR